jgi:ABC-type multidrug transport system fused ATPase/permease subunit
MLTIDILKNFLSENKGLLIAYFIANLFALSLKSIVLSYFESRIFNCFSKSGSPDLKKIQNLIIWTILVVILIKIGYTIKGYVYNIIVPSFHKYTKIFVYDLILERYKINYQDIKLGYVITNLHHIPVTLNALMVELLSEYIPNVLILIICSVYVFYLDKKIGFVAIMGLVLIGLIIYVNYSNGIAYSSNEYAIERNNNEFVQDRLGNLFNIYVSGTGTAEYEEYENAEDILKDAAHKSYQFNTNTTVLIEIISTLVYVIVLYLVYRYFATKFMSPSNIILVILVMTYYASYLSSISNNYTGLVCIMGSLTQSDTFLKELETSGPSGPSGTPVQALNHVGASDITGPIQFIDISFNYPVVDSVDSVGPAGPVTGMMILDKVNITINKNSMVAIFGKSGSGKTTLIKLLLGFYSPSEGRILVNGHDIKTLDVNVLRSSMSVVDQNLKLFNKSVIDNMLYGSVSVTYADVIDMLNEYDIMSVYSGLKDGLNTLAGVNGSMLSGGQRQVIMIIRALLKNTNVLLLDEPTSALDANTKKIILGLLKKIRSKTIIIITHDDDILSYVDKSYVLKNGRIENK